MVLDLLNVRAWAMESRFFERAYPIVLSLLSQGRDLSRLQSAIFPNANELDRNSGMSVYKAANGKSVGMFRIAGGLTKDGDLCAYGMRDYIKIIESAIASEKTDAIVIEMDTPGGSVDGTPELGLAVRESKKPVVIFADGMVASAGYWIASQASEIVANAANYTEIGSLGTLFVHENYANVIEAGNFPNVRIIRAPQSKDKALINVFEALGKDQEKEIIADLKQFTEDFIGTVRSGRGSRLKTGDEDIFTGKIYDKSKALAMGMIDAIGSRQDAIDRAGILAENKQVPEQVRENKIAPAVSGKNSNSNISMKFPKISSLFGQADAEVKEELSAEDQAELAAAEQRLTEQESQLAARAARIAELEAQNSELTANIEKLTSRIAELEAKLEKAPAGAATTVIAKADEFEDDDDAKRFETSEDREVMKMKKSMGLP